MAPLGCGQEHGTQAVVQLHRDADQGTDDTPHHLFPLKLALHLVVMETQVLGGGGGGGAGGLWGEEVCAQQSCEHCLQFFVSVSERNTTIVIISF